MKTVFNCEPYISIVEVTDLIMAKHWCPNKDRKDVFNALWAMQSDLRKPFVETYIGEFLTAYAWYIVENTPHLKLERNDYADLCEQEFNAEQIAKEISKKCIHGYVTKK